MAEPQFPWHMLTISHQMTEVGFVVTINTNRACHCYLRYSKVYPRIHRKGVLRRGVVFGWDARFCFVSYQHIEQNEPGDTYRHTFTWPDWLNCWTRYFYFFATVGGFPGVSDSPIFWMHYLWVTPPIIVREGITRLALREGNYDRTGEEPPYNRYKTSYFLVSMRDDIEDHWPYLEITYHLGSNPPITVKYFPTPGSAGVAADGYTQRVVDNSTWVNIHSHPGTDAHPSYFAGYIGFTCGDNDDTWYDLMRTLLHFDTTLLPQTAIIDAASVHLHGQSKSNTIPSNPTLALVQSSDPSPGDITPPNYQDLRSENIAPVIPYADFDADGWNVFTLPEEAYENE